jgi:hypothetical protein
MVAGKVVDLRQAKRVYDLVGAGLVKGVGKPNPGEMCVEAAICFALDEPHGDQPKCVGGQDRSFSVTLNDAAWSSNEARAKGMKRLAIAQLGSNQLSEAQRQEWLRLLVTGTVRKIVPIALRSAASLHHLQEHKDALESEAKKCESVEESAACSAAWSAAESAWSAARSARSARSAWSAESARSAAWSPRSAAESAWSAAESAACSAAESARAAARAAESAESARDQVLSTMAEVAVDAYIKINTPGAELLKQIEQDQTGAQ